MPIKHFQKQVIQDQLKKLRSVFDELSRDAPLAPRQAMYRDEARIFAQSFGNDANADYADAMLSLDRDGAVVFLRVSNDLLRRVRDEREVELDIESHQEKMDFGILFAFVLQRLLVLEHKSPGLYGMPLR